MAPGDSLLTLTASAWVDYFANQYSIMQPGHAHGAARTSTTATAAPR
ncbi:MAG: hypothetical protein R3A10_00285 [Caldilineaceae bacterium]